MKIAIITLIAIFLIFARASPVVEAEQGIEGILVNTLAEIGLKVHECIQDGDLIFENIRHAVDALGEAAKTKSKAKLLEGLQYIRDTLMRISEEVKGCETIPELVEALEKISAESVNPEALIIDIRQKIIWYAISTYHNITGAVSNFRSSQTESAVKNIGDAIKTIDLSMPQDGADDAIIFTKALYQSAFNIALSLDGCKASIESSWAKVLAAIMKIESPNPFEIIEGLTALINAIPDFLDSFKTCEADWPQIQQGILKLQPFVNFPVLIPIAVTEAIFLNPLEFPMVVVGIFSAFTSSPPDFRLGGSGIGSILKMVLRYMPNNVINHKTLEDFHKTHGESI